MPRDRLVVGITDATLSDRLQLDTIYAYLGKGEETGTPKGSSPGAQRRADPPPPQATLEDVTRKTSGTDRHSKGTTSGKLRTAPTATKCQCCGRNKHESPDKCPARNIICHRCKKKGHFRAYCQSKVTASTSEEGNSTWRNTVNLDRTNVNFTLDTGTEVTAIKYVQATSWSQEIATAKQSAVWPSIPVSEGHRSVYRRAMCQWPFP
jgi:hypothetical protein